MPRLQQASIDRVEDGAAVPGFCFADENSQFFLPMAVGLVAFSTGLCQSQPPRRRGLRWRLRLFCAVVIALQQELPVMDAIKLRT